MNLAIVWSPNLGSGSIVRFGTSRRLGIGFQFRCQRIAGVKRKQFSFSCRHAGSHLFRALSSAPYKRTQQTARHRGHLPPVREVTVRQLFVASGELPPSRLLRRPLSGKVAFITVASQLCRPVYGLSTADCLLWQSAQSRLLGRVRTLVVSRRISSGPVVARPHRTYPVFPGPCDSARQVNLWPCHPVSIPPSVPADCGLPPRYNWSPQSRWWGAHAPLSVMPN